MLHLLDIPMWDDEFISVVSATKLSASLQSNNPTVSLSISVFYNSSIALT